MRRGGGIGQSRLPGRGRPHRGGTPSLALAAVGGERAARKFEGAWGVTGLRQRSLRRHRCAKYCRFFILSLLAGPNSLTIISAKYRSLVCPLGSVPFVCPPPPRALFTAGQHLAGNRGLDCGLAWVDFLQTFLGGGCNEDKALQLRYQKSGGSMCVVKFILSMPRGRWWQYML